MRFDIKKNWFVALILAFATISCSEETPQPGYLQLIVAEAGTTILDTQNAANNTAIEPDAVFKIRFSAELDAATLLSSVELTTNNQVVELKTEFGTDAKTLLCTPIQTLKTNTVFTFNIKNSLKGKTDEQFAGLSIGFTTKAGLLAIVSYKIDNTSFSIGAKPQNIKLEPTIEITFSAPLSTESVTSETVKLVNSFGKPAVLSFSFLNENKTLKVEIAEPLEHLSKHFFNLTAQLKGAQSETFAGSTAIFYTETDNTPKFPLLTDDELLNKIQQSTFKYFYDFAHPASGMSRERNNSGDLITIGGSGFGLMAIIVGVERGFITRTQALEHWNKMLTFLEKAERFHGAWGHWYNGNTGKLIPFSTKDNGGDLVETSFLAQGLVTLRQYLNPDTEAQTIARIDALLDTIEWNWYNHDNQNMLSWHWSPTVGWAMGMHIRGYNEALISYVMAASSKNYAIDKQVYTTGWAGTSYFNNGKTYYGYTLPLGFEYGGPLFFAHYSFLGLDPRNLSDSYANYWQQNVSHTQINRNYCITNPRSYQAYSENCWGLTASDEPSGYGVHEPTRDIGVISPTAALSSFPYTPDESLKVAKFLYYTLGDRVWGEYGFYDAFSINDGWWGKTYLAIDQGPIIIMIENYRTGKLWDLFMQNPEVKNGLDKLGFAYVKTQK